jgi:carbonic anhydrase
MQILNLWARTGKAAVVALPLLIVSSASPTFAEPDAHAPAPKSLAKPASKPAAAPKHADADAKPKAPAKADEHDNLGAKNDHAPSGQAENNDHAGDKPASKASEKLPSASESDEAPDADTVMKWLREGNQRWVAGKPIDPNIEPARRARLAAAGQKPIVTILSCADSRVPADRIFDRGVGELFVVRVAGNVAGDSETGTVEYGVGHLKTPLLVVMGHSKCGAVAAAASGAQLHGKVAQLVAGIVPSVDRAKRNNPGLTGDDLVAAAVRENVWQTVYDLFKQSPELAKAARDGQVRVVGAVCDITSGEVEFLGTHPWQAELIDALAAGRADDTTKTANAHE